jgi:hypothetical protein
MKNGKYNDGSRKIISSPELLRKPARHRYNNYVTNGISRNYPTYFRKCSSKIPFISFSATFTIVESTISSKAQRIAVMVIITRLAPYSTNESCINFISSFGVLDLKRNAFS